MAKIKQHPVTDVAESVHALYRNKAEDWRRDHLGASIIGHRCDRYLWLSFRWIAAPDHDGRLLRLFERGQREEDWIVEDLRRAGFKVQSVDPHTGKQLRAGEGHIGGSLDGLIEGCAEDPEEIHVLEIKTSNAKQWERLREKGVRSAKPVHYVQMQIYMHKRELRHALYVSVCKDNDEIYTERVPYSAKTAEKHLQRARDVVESAAPPKKLDKDFAPCVLFSKDGTRWPCQFYENCHGKKMPERHCRSCISSMPVNTDEGPKWECRLSASYSLFFSSEERAHLRTLSSAKQREGCSRQVSVPMAVNADISHVDLSQRTITYQFGDGTKVTER
jgi:hypothetical protein